MLNNLSFTATKIKDFSVNMYMRTMQNEGQGLSVYPAFSICAASCSCNINGFSFNRYLMSTRTAAVDMCQCHMLGSYSRSCDPVTRQCACKTAVGGRRCDRCTPGYWGLALIRDYVTGCLRTYTEHTSVSCRVMPMCARPLCFTRVLCFFFERLPRRSPNGTQPNFATCLEVSQT